jgi:uncharacterized iron-regulated membrane protein
MRRVAVLLHRWIGLALAGFLLVAGITGALLAWYHELDAWLAPGLSRAAPPAADARPIDPLVLRERVAARYPGARVDTVPLHVEAGHAAVHFLAPPSETEAAGAAGPDVDEVFVDPYTGTILGARKWGELRDGATDLMPFVYRLHHSLALGVVGSTAFGVIALLWTLDCFVGFALTLPSRTRAARAAVRTGADGTGWWAGWRPAWRVRFGAGAYRTHFDLHRAGGLWLWPMLLVLAWSSVSFNLQQVYHPVMRTVLGMQPALEALASTPRERRPSPEMGWRRGLDTARALMADAAATEGFTVRREQLLRYEPAFGAFTYRVLSDRDVGERWGSTALSFDARTGERLRLFLPTGRAAGDTVTTWITTLHMAAVWGLPLRVFVTFAGLVVAMLSVTGAYLWWRKRAARRAGAARRADDEGVSRPQGRATRAARSRRSAA